MTDDQNTTDEANQFAANILMGDIKRGQHMPKKQGKTLCQVFAEEDKKNRPVTKEEVDDAFEQFFKRADEPRQLVPHSIPLGALVELKNGTRLFVVEHTRRVDGRPDYTLSSKCRDSEYLVGFGADDLKVISVPKIKKKYTAIYTERTLTYTKMKFAHIETDDVNGFLKENQHVELLFDGWCQHVE